jgi:anti-sigma factor RsiW
MHCEKYNHLLSALADDGLSGRQKNQVQDHLVHCRRCCEDMAEINALKSLLYATRVNTPEPTAIERTLRHVRERSVRRMPRAVIVRFEYSAIIAAGLIALAFTIHAPFSSHPVPVPTPVADMTVDPAALVSIHAIARFQSPLAESGKLRNAIVESNALDYSQDAQFDVH